MCLMKAVCAPHDRTQFMQLCGAGTKLKSLSVFMLCWLCSFLLTASLMIFLLSSGCSASGLWSQCHSQSPHWGVWWWSGVQALSALQGQESVGGLECSTSYWYWCLCKLEPAGASSCWIVDRPVGTPWCCFASLPGREPASDSQMKTQHREYSLQRIPSCLRTSRHYHWSWTEL